MKCIIEAIDTMELLVSSIFGDYMPMLASTTTLRSSKMGLFDDVMVLD